MNSRKNILYTAIITVCFLYAGSAYMSQSFRLMDYYSTLKVDIISSVVNYMLQAFGILTFSLGLIKKPNLFGNRKLFVCLLGSGILFMTLSQLSNSGLVIQLAGYVFNLHVGIYFGFYLAMLSKNIPMGESGFYFGLAYAIASVGTYAMSLAGGGDYLISKEITALYIILAAITIGLVFASDNLIPETKHNEEDQNLSEDTSSENLPITALIKAYFPQFKELNLHYLIPLIAIITTVFVIGSGLYYSLPAAENVNWILIRAFYAIGLILAGIIIDKNRFLGEVLAIAGLTYPLIMLTLIGDGFTSTLALGISYVLRGFITIYYIISFTNIGAKDHRLLFLAPIGLMVSRITEAIITIIFLLVDIPEIFQLIFSAACFLPMLALFVAISAKKYSPAPISDEKRFALYSEKYNLTSREMEILKCLKEGMSDSEIAEKFYISKNTVRFHVSNLLKKTNSSSRVHAVQSLDKFSL